MKISNLINDSGREYLVKILNNEDPTIAATMKLAKINPCGIRSTTGESLVASGVKAGVHSRTNVYILPSNKDCTRPRQRILLSETIFETVKTVRGALA